MDWRGRGGVLSPNWLNIDASPYINTSPTLLMVLSLRWPVISLTKLAIYFCKCAIVFDFNVLLTHSAPGFIDQKPWVEGAVG